MERKFVAPKKLGAIGWSCLILAVLLLAGIVWRLNIVNFFLPKETPEQSEYLVSFRVANIRSTSADFFSPGAEFRIDGSEEIFGTITGNVSVTPAEKYVEDEDGKLGLVYDSGEGDSARIDLTGVFLVNASDNSTKDLLMLNGKTYIAPNQEITIGSSQYVESILITGIAQKMPNH